MSSETPKPETKYTAGQTEIALAKFNARKAEDKYVWLPEEEYAPLPKKKKKFIHQLRADAYRDDKTPDKQNFRKLLLDHAEKCIKSIERFNKKQETAAQGDTPAGPGNTAPGEGDAATGEGDAATGPGTDTDNFDQSTTGPKSKQMKNPFLV